MSMSELVEGALDGDRLEGEQGLVALEKLFSLLGYKKTHWRFGELIEVFLADNSGAIEAIVNWVGEQNVSEWRDRLEEAQATAALEASELAEE